MGIPSLRLGRWILGTDSIDSPSERTQMGPLSPAGILSPLGAATRSSTPSNALPTVSGSLPERSMASGPACVL